MTPDPKELVERLRKLAAQTVREGDAYAGPDYHNGRRLTAADTMYAAAADLIQQQAERIERLEGAIRECRLADGYAARTGDEYRWDRAFHALCWLERAALSTVREKD